MTFHTFNPSSDTLEVGTKIRIEEAEIIKINQDFDRTPYLIRYNDGKEDWVALENRDHLEIIPPAKPLTIDKRVKEGVMKAYHQWADDSEDKLDNVMAYLNSLEET